MKYGRLLLVLLLSVRGVAAQDPVAFEVASIKVRTERVAGAPQSSPDRYHGINTSLRGLIQEAYGLQSYQVLGGPDWVGGSVRFDVVAKAPFVPSREQMRRMLQRLLAERFALQLHSETRELPVYELRMVRQDARLGKGLTKTSVDCAVIEAQRKSKEGRGTFEGPDGRPLCHARQIAMPSAGGLTLRYQASGITTGELAVWVSQYVGRTVFDQTGLTGDFDVDLAFDPSALRPGAPVDAVSLFAAVEEQLGLKLESSKGPVSVLVVDNAQMPTPD